MVCYKHPNRQAQGTCAVCGQPFCEECLVDVAGTLYCKEHIADIISSKEKQSESSTHQGNGPVYYHSGQTPPPPPGYRQVGHEHHYHDHNIYHHYDAYPRKSRVVALLLCIFLGWGGIHRFYTGKIGTGLLWLFTGGLFGIGYIVDIVCLVIGVFRDSNGYLLE